MGVPNVEGFVNMWGAIAQGDYLSAYDHALDSKWFRIDTPERAKRVAEVIRSGNMEVYTIN